MSVLNDEERLREAAKESGSMREVLDRMGVSGNSGSANYRTLKKYAKMYDISLPTGAGGLGNPKVENEKLFSDRGVHVNGSTLRKRMVRDLGMENKCALCNLSDEWNGLPIVLQVDHINGKNTDNHIDNLRLLCPNCHSQTDTFCGKKPNKCECGASIGKRSKRCRGCVTRAAASKEEKNSSINPGWVEKIPWPSVEEVISMVESEGYSATGKKLKVSDNAVRKFLSRNDIDYRTVRKKSLRG